MSLISLALSGDISTFVMITTFAGVKPANTPSVTPRSRLMNIFEQEPRWGFPSEVQNECSFLRIAIWGSFVENLRTVCQQQNVFGAQDGRTAEKMR